MPNYSKFFSIKSTIRLAVNIIGALAYLRYSMPLWVPDELANIPGAGAGDPVIWGLTAFPILILFALMNFYWAFTGTISFYKTREWGLNVTDLVGPAVWVISVNIDYSHHWRL